MRRQSRIIDPTTDRPFVVEDRPTRTLNAGYDIVLRRGESDNWKYATPSSANALDTPETRQQLRDMARFEYRNNPHMRGLVQKISHEVVGTGPRMEIEPESVSPESEKAAQRLEDLTNEHLQQVNVAGKLYLNNTERCVGGEAFNVFHRNPLNEVPIDFTVYEGEQFATPHWNAMRDGSHVAEYGPVDGIDFDDWGNPHTYYRLRYHPHGNGMFAIAGQDFDRLDASVVSHVFRKDRPSQFRGIPEVAPMLGLYSQLRRFIESKVGQEELRAKMTGTLETGFSPSDCAAVGDDPIDLLISGGHFMNLPDGWKANLFQQQVTGMGVAEFVRACLSWATQALLTPWNISAGDSSDYNFASGRLDYIIFYRVVDVIRKHLERTLLDPYFKLFLGFAEFANRYPSRLGRFKATWYWPPRKAIDEEKQARADGAQKESGLLDEAEYWQRNSAMSWKEAELQKIRIEKFRKEQRTLAGLDPEPESNDPSKQPQEDSDEAKTAA